jgi:ABC-type transport system involved in multi-copper enzyme maturation permease subunit
MKVTDAKKMFAKMCTPAQVYTVLVFLSCLLYVYHMVRNTDDINRVGGASVHTYTIIGLVVKVVFSLLWVLILNYICQRFKHGNAIAWVLLLIPLLFFAFTVVMMLFVISQVAVNARSQEAFHDEIHGTMDALKSTQTSMSNPAVVPEPKIPESKAEGFDWQGQRGFSAV